MFFFGWLSFLSFVSCLAVVCSQNAVDYGYYGGGSSSFSFSYKPKPDPKHKPGPKDPKLKPDPKHPPRVLADQFNYFYDGGATDYAAQSISFSYKPEPKPPVDPIYYYGAGGQSFPFSYYKPEPKKPEPKKPDPKKPEPKYPPKSNTGRRRVLREKVPGVIAESERKN